MRTKLYKLYHSCFKDVSEDVAGYYIRTRFDGENVSVITDGGSMSSILFTQKHKMLIGGAIFENVMIDGICTREISRGKGQARKNVYDVLKKLANEGEVVVTAYPTNEKLLDPLGFTPFAMAEKVEVKKGEVMATPLNTEDARAMLELYNDYAQNNAYAYPFMTVDDMGKKIELFLTDGEVVGYFEDGELKAYVMYFKKENVCEAIFEDEKYLQYLDIESYNLPSLQGDMVGVIRVLDIEKFLKQVKYHSEFVLKLKIQLVDNLIEKNNMAIMFEVNNGVANVEVLPNGTECDIEYTVQDLVSTIMRTSISLGTEKY